MESSLNEAMLQLQASDLAMKDMELYLDTHPNDIAMVMKYNLQCQKSMMLRNEVENKYNHPLTPQTSAMYGGCYRWINSPWPWNVDFPSENAPCNCSDFNVAPCKNGYQECEYKCSPEVCN